MELFNELKNKFGDIFIITLSSRADRQEHIFNQLYKIGMKDKNDVHIIYATPFPYNDLIADAFNKSRKGRFTKPNEYDCSRNHYSVVRQSYDLGYKYCLVIEDDVLFLNDEAKWKSYIDNIPENFDILQFGAFTGDPKITKYLGEDKGFWLTHKDVGLWNASMYALSRRGMEFYLSFMKKVFWVADGPLYKAPLNDKYISTYISTIPLVIQADKNIITSDIRNANTDSIDYNNDNLYEQYIDNYNYIKD